MKPSYAHPGLRRLGSALTIAIGLGAAVALVCGCDEDKGPPYSCGPMTCNGSEACIHEIDGAARDDYSCAPDRMCANPAADYCPGADSSFCRVEPPAASTVPDAGAQLVTTIECRYRAP